MRCFNNTTGSNNYAFGTDALFNNTSGSYNTAMGVSALKGSLVQTGTLTGFTGTGGAAQRQSPILVPAVIR